jgi:hypothetical protein
MVGAENGPIRDFTIRGKPDNPGFPGRPAGFPLPEQCCLDAIIAVNSYSFFL